MSNQIIIFKPTNKFPMKLKLQVLMFSAIAMLSASSIKALAINAMPFQTSMDTFNAVSGTVVDAPYADDVGYSNLPIGFTFNFGGGTFTTFSATTNGWISLGGTGSFAQYFNVLSGTTNNVLAPFGGDLQNNGTLRHARGADHVRDQVVDP